MWGGAGGDRGDNADAGMAPGSAGTRRRCVPADGRRVPAAEWGGRAERAAFGCPRGTDPMRCSHSPVRTGAPSPFARVSRVSFPRQARVHTPRAFSVPSRGGPRAAAV